MSEPFVECSAQCGCGREVTAKAGVRDGQLVVQLRASGQAIERTTPMPSVRVVGVSDPESVGPSLAERIRRGSGQ